MAAPAPVDFNSIPDGPLYEILLRLDRLTAAAFVSSLWRGIASDKKFLKGFRERHPSSPLLGIFASDPQGRVSLFRNISNDPDLRAVVRNADTALVYIDRDWCIQDCRNGRLLLSNQENELFIYGPLSQLRVPLPKHDDDTAGKYMSHSLLDGNGKGVVVSVQRRGKSEEAVVSYRVISIQQSRQDIRAVEYDPSMPEWHAHQWLPLSTLTDDRHKPRWDLGPMYAAGHIFWRYGGTSSLLVLDTTTMRFSTLILRGTLNFPRYLRFAIGEIEDGKACLVCLQVPDPGDLYGIHISTSRPETLLQVWLLEKMGDNICCKFKEQVSVSKLLGADAEVWNVSTVVNGLALLSKHERSGQYVVDLQNMTRLADVMFRGKGYLYQMPWPPAGLAAATTAKSSPPQKDNCIDNLLSTSSRHDGVDLAHEGGTDGDQHSKLSSNNRMKDPPSSSVVDTTCSQNQYTDPHDVNEAGGDEAAPSENHHTLKSPVNRTKAVEVENSITHLNSAQHDLSEKASLDLDGDSARIEPVEMYPSHELTLQNAPAIPSVSCNVAIRIDKSETSNLQDNTTDGAEMFEPQNCDKAHQEVTCANNVSETDEEPGGQRKKLKTNETSNACPQELDQHISSPSSCSNPFVVESEIISTTIVRKNNLRVPCQKSSMGKLATTRYKPQNKDASICPQQGDPPRKPRWKEAAHPKGARRTRSSHVVQCQNSSMRRPATTEKPLCKRNNLVRVNNLTDEEPGGQWKKLKTKATSISCPEELVQHIRSPSSCNPTTVHQNNPTVPFGNISMRQKATTQHARTNNAKANLHVEDGNAMLECNSKGCKRMFPTISSLNRHRREVHENGKCIPCGRCDEKFTRPEYQKIHFERMHNPMATTCQFKGCTEEFPDKHARKTHEKSNQHVDDGTKKIKCHFKGCPRKYPSMQKQNWHYKESHKSPGVQ